MRSFTEEFEASNKEIIEKHKDEDKKI